MILPIAIVLTVGLFAVVCFDATRFIIPNALNLGFILLYPIFLLTVQPEIEWWWSIAVMVAAFGVGILIFMTNIIGGGDIKLLIALSLWVGWDVESLKMFGVWTAVSGGILALFLIFARLGIVSIGAVTRHKIKAPQVLRMDEPLPYGLAIAYAFGWLLWTGQIQGLPVRLSQFF